AGKSVINGKLEPDVGGGVCRLSTALHQAVMQAGLEVVERYNHSIPVSYASGEYEAAVSWPAGDYRFKNTLDRPVQIDTIASRDGIEVIIWILA
ncbi:VanW family protein, partial [Desulfocucumis palustris]|uniref:VanW family protein n=1 Tax=Desulfocucumis palustris TaxID=1898651 RepID=UPI0013FD581E